MVSSAHLLDQKSHILSWYLREVIRSLNSSQMKIMKINGKGKKDLRCSHSILLARMCRVYCSAKKVVGFRPIYRLNYPVFT